MSSFVTRTTICPVVFLLDSPFHTGGNQATVRFNSERVNFQKNNELFLSVTCRSYQPKVGSILRRYSAHFLMIFGQ